MKLLFMVFISIGVLSSTLFSAPLDVRPDPPVADPVLPTEKDPFFVNSSNVKAHTPVSGAKLVHHQDLNKKILIALVMASTLLGAILLFLLCFSIHRLKKLKKNHEKTNESPVNSNAAKGISLGPILNKFTSSRIGSRNGSIAEIEYRRIVAATNNFHQDNILGEGKSGHIYKAHLNNGLHGAVKKLSAGEQKDIREFENEVEWLTKLEHQNIISLLGYCIHGDGQYLVYELMHNGSLEFQLHGPSHGKLLTWHIRMKIALDVARGLEYLHERCNPPVIHRDIKSSNILLDSNFNAKLSDFGLAITSVNSNKTNIKLSGTLGYVAPEYLLDGKLTDKSDVYAFGVVLLELLLGRRPVERLAEGQCQSIVTWAMPQLTDRFKLPNIVDPAIRNKMDLKHLYQVAAIAVLCVQPEPSYRPLITDVLHSFIPLVPLDLGGSLRVTDSAFSSCA